METNQREAFEKWLKIREDKYSPPSPYEVWQAALASAPAVEAPREFDYPNDEIREQCMKRTLEVWPHGNRISCSREMMVDMMQCAAWSGYKSKEAVLQPSATQTDVVNGFEATCACGLTLQMHTCDHDAKIAEAKAEGRKEGILEAIAVVNDRRCGEIQDRDDSVHELALNEVETAICQLAEAPTTGEKE